MFFFANFVEATDLTLVAWWHESRNEVLKLSTEFNYFRYIEFQSKYFSRKSLSFSDLSEPQKHRTKLDVVDLQTAN